MYKGIDMKDLKPGGLYLVRVKENKWNAEVVCKVDGMLNLLLMFSLLFISTLALMPGGVILIVLFLLFKFVSDVKTNEGSIEDE